MKGGNQRSSVLTSPRREYLILGSVAVCLVATLWFPELQMALLVAAVLGSLPVLGRGLEALDWHHPRITIDVFNLFALGVAFATGEFKSAAFIVLMITSADLLDWRSMRRTHQAVELLLKRQPLTAVRERGIELERIAADHIKAGDVVVVAAGESIPADGVVVSGEAAVNEALMTGESMPVEKSPGMRVMVSTIVQTGALKIKAMHVGASSTLERMARLIRDASANKSHAERLADRFAAVFLPLVVILGIVVYIRTGNLEMTAALFLVACADDMALAIPLAVTAALGQAARKGVVIKGGAALNMLADTKTIVLDKTGTLTYGTFSIQNIWIDPAFAEHIFWRAVGISNKFSEHPVSHALLKEAYRHAKAIADPDSVQVHKGSGIIVTAGPDTIAIGNEDIIAIAGIHRRPSIEQALERAQEHGSPTLVFINGTLAGTISIADTIRKEAPQSIRRLEHLGIANIMMFTGDTESVAKRIGAALGIRKIKAHMKPEDKLRALERIRERPVMMVGDGINDAPALARSDVGVAMGRGGAAIAAESADVVVLTDNLIRLPEMIVLGRRTVSVIHWDMVIWALSNVVGFWLVLSGTVGPAFAAFYNFATDFLPLINSVRLFRSSSRS